MLQRIFKIFIAIAVIVNLINSQNLLYLEGNEKINTSTVEVNLILSNTDTVKGIQATLKLDKPFLKLDTIIAFSNNFLFRYYAPDSVTINFVMLASSGYELKPGKTTLAKIKFNVLKFNTSDSVNIRFENLLMIAPKAQKLNATANGITLKFTAMENELELKFNINYSSIVAWLKNSEKVRKLNIELKIKNGSTAEFVSLMPRSAGFMKLNYEIEDNMVKINLISRDENGLESGEGEIFFVTGKFNNADDVEISKLEVINSNGTIATPNFKLITTSIYPVNFKLEQNYPNPFNPATTIKFTIPKDTRVQIAVFDINGRLVKILVDKILPAGEHITVWDGTDENGSSVSSGVYLYRMYADGFVNSKKMLLIK